MYTFARAVLAVVIPFERRKYFYLLVLFSVCGAVTGVIGLVTGDWDFALQVPGCPLMLVCLVGAFAMLARLFFPATFLRAEQDLCGTRDGDV